MALPPAPRRITLLSDFGTADGYTAAMRGIIAARAPDIEVVDATHEIGPGDIAAGAAALARYWDLFPEGTVHIAVVDPGVGGGRRGLVVEASSRIGVGPDNGLLEPLLGCADSVREIRNADLYRRQLSNTFHGRDIFAPVAAYLAGGGLVARVGPAVGNPVRLVESPAVVDGPEIAGVVTHIDRFGTLITNIPGGLVRSGSVVRVRDQAMPLRSTFADVEPGGTVAFIGSRGFLEIAVRDGSAAGRLMAARGTAVHVGPDPGPRMQEGPDP